jgi:hypothetical protein
MAKQQDRADQVKKAVKEDRSWVENNDESFRDSALKSLREDLKANDFDAVKTISVPLDQLIHYYGFCGVIEVIDGDFDGWVTVDRAIRHHYWRIKIRSTVALMQTRLDYPEKFNGFNQLMFEMPIVPSLICYGIMHDLQRLRDELWALWKVILNTPDTMRESYWGQAADGMYELFSFRLFAQTPWGGGAKLPDRYRSSVIGPYAPLLNAWERLEMFPRALSQACDYHCANLIDAD